MSSIPDDVSAPDAGKQQQWSTASAAAIAEVDHAGDPVALPASAELIDEEVAARHRAWMAEHRKSYADEAERERRLSIFRDNLRYIEAHNRGGHSYTLGLNHFADLTTEEFRATYCGGSLEPTPAEAPPQPSDDLVAARAQEEEEGGSRDGDGRSPPRQAPQDP